MIYTDTEIPSSITYTIYRTDTDQLVYNQVWTGTNSVSSTYTVPVAAAPIYNVRLTANRSAGQVVNTWPITTGTGPVPQLPMNVYERNAVFTILLCAIAGLGGRIHSAKLALGVALAALMFSFFQWITIPIWMCALACAFAYFYMAGGEKD